ncbi:MAG: hypothetical protein ACPGRC_05170 [Salibacteraceae bacterium]
MIKVLKWTGLFILLGLVTPTFMSCQPQPTVTTNPDLTTDVVGEYQGNYVVKYEANPSDDFSSQITLVVSRVDKTVIRLDAQGGDAFQCYVTGTASSLTLSGIHETSGVYNLATDIEGFYRSGTLYYKVTGISNGGNFEAEFTVL